MARAAEIVRAAGGYVIADEVQAGYCRTGRWWGYEGTGFTPDIVVTGKPMGNGLPLAATAASKAAGRRLPGARRAISTPSRRAPCRRPSAWRCSTSSSATAWRENVARVGASLKAALGERKKTCAAIGDVRGHGLFIGVEMVKDRQRARRRTPTGRSRSSTSSRTAASSPAMPAPSGTSSRSGRRWSSGSATPTSSSPPSTRRLPRSMDKAADGVAADTFTPAAREALKAFPIEPDALELVSLAENVTYRVVDRRDGVAYALAAAPAVVSHPRRADLGARLDPRAGRRGHRRADAGAHPRRPGIRVRDDPGHRRDSASRAWRAGPTGRVLAAGAARNDRHQDRRAAISPSSAPSPRRCTTRPRPGGRRRGSRAMRSTRTASWATRRTGDRSGITKALSDAERRLMLDVRARLHAALARLEPAARRLQHDPRRHASRQRPGRRRGAHRHRLRRRGLGLACLRHRGGPGASARRPPWRRSSAPTSRATARCGRSPTRRLPLLPMFRLVRGLAQIGWYHQRPSSTGRTSLKRPRPSCSTSACRSGGRFELAGSADRHGPLMVFRTARLPARS